MRPSHPRRFLLEVWYTFSMIIIISLFFENVLTARVESVAFWLRLAALTAMIVLAFFVILDHQRKAPESDGQRRLERVYTEQLRRKDIIIEDLKRRNQMLLRTAFRQAEKTSELSRHARQLAKDAQEQDTTEEEK